MSTLYGKVDLGNPERQEFFGEARKQLQQYVTLQEAEKAAEEKAMQDAGDVPPLSSVGLYQRDFDAAQQMANILRDKKNEMLSTDTGRAEYQRGIDELKSFLSDRKTYYNTTHPILVQNTRDKKNRYNRPEWSSRGEMDGRTLDDYIAKTAELDTNRFKVKFEGGSFVLADQAGDHAINDPSLMDLSWFDEDNYLVQTPPTRPEDWYNINQPKGGFETKDDAESFVESKIMLDDTGLSSRDAARWYVNSEENQSAEKPLTEEQVMGSEGAMERAIAAYASDAVEKAWRAPKKKEKKDSKSTRQAESFDVLSSAITTGMSVPTLVDGEEVSVQATYAPLSDANVVVPWDGGEEEGKRYKVDGIYLDNEGPPVLALVTSQGIEYVPIQFGDNMYNEINSKMASKYGKDALTKLLRQMD